MVILPLLFLTLMVNAQKGKIMSFKIIGMDFYPSGPKLHTEVTVEYSQVGKGQLDLIVYADNAPLPFGNVTRKNPYGVPSSKICNDYLLLSPTKNTVTKTYTFLVPIKFKSLTNGDNDIFYVAAVLLDTNNEKLMELIKTQAEISKLKITTYQESTNSPQEKEKRAREHAAEVESSKAMGQLGKTVGALLLGNPYEKEVCSNCGGVGCSVCNGIGYDYEKNFNRSAFDIGVEVAEQSDSEKKIHGNYTKIYENGDKYSGNFKNGLRHGKGTYIHADGEKYVGDWEYGNRTGFGELITTHGYNYKGEFVDNQMHGNGELTVPGGNKYIGWFHQNKMSGIGTIYLKKDKTYIKGIWEDGELMKILERGPYNEAPKAKTTTSAKKKTPVTTKKRK